MRHVTGRAIGALVTTSLVLGLLAAPASAGAPSTVYVAPGPDSAALTGGSCDSPDFVSIQAAVDAAGSGDTILVCPGTYREQVTIVDSPEEITIRATEPWKAVLRPPASIPCSGAASGTASCGVPHAVAGARPAGPGFNLLTISGADDITVQWLKLLAPTQGTCVRVDSMITLVNDADNAVIRANRLRPGGTATLAGACGYVEGITIGGGSSALVSHNLVQDFQGDGIIALGAGTSADVHRNSVRYRHAAQGPGGGSNGNGVRLADGATGRIRANAIVGLATAGTSTPRLGQAIALTDLAGGVVVRRNLVRRAALGIFVSLTTGARLRQNDARLNATYDCYDDSLGGTPGAPSFGTRNTWIDNTGDTVDPAGICTAP